MKEKKSKKTTTVASNTPVAASQEKSCCCCCKPASYGLLKTTCLCGSILGASLIISTAVFFKTPSTNLPSPRFIKPVVNETVIKKYIESHPQVITDIVAKYLQENAPKPAAAAAPAPAPAPQADIKGIINEITADKSNYSLGNPNGKYVIIEFFDYQCGWCKRTNAGLHEAIAKPEGKNIRWIAIDTPIFGEKSEEIARFVLAAGKQGKYAQMHEAVGTAKTLDKASLIALGAELGLDTKQLEADADSAEIKGKLRANRKYAEQLNIRGVPFLIVNGKTNPGALLGEKLEEAVRESQGL